MSLLDSPLGSPSTADSLALRSDVLEDAFLAWAEDPAKPELVDLGEHGRLPMAALARHLERSRNPLTVSGCRQIGLPTGVTIGAAAMELLHATIDPAGPRCRSFRSASYYLRGLARLDRDLGAITRFLSASAEESRGDPHGR